MSSGTAIFVIGLLAIFTLIGGTVWFTRLLRAEAERMRLEADRIDAELEERRREIRSGARPTKGRFRL